MTFIRYSRFSSHKTFMPYRTEPDRCERCGELFMNHYNSACPITDSDEESQSEALRDLREAQDRARVRVAKRERIKVLKKMMGG